MPTDYLSTLLSFLFCGAVIWLTVYFDWGGNAVVASTVTLAIGLVSLGLGIVHSFVTPGPDQEEE